jgi:hypothetical protein
VISSNSACASSLRVTIRNRAPHRRTWSVSSQAPDHQLRQFKLPGDAGCPRSSASTIGRCRILAYIGERSVQSLLYDTDNCLVRQSYSPRMMFLNLAGFGMKAGIRGRWDP